MRQDILAGLLDAVGRLEKPCEAGKELEERIARTKTVFVLDVDLLCLLDDLGKEIWGARNGPCSMAMGVHTSNIRPKSSQSTS